MWIHLPNKILTGRIFSRMGLKQTCSEKKNWITASTVFLSAVLCSFILYSLISPLPQLPSISYNNPKSITNNTIQAVTSCSAQTYLKLLKTRNLFKPSIPIPARKKIGKTTAQKLAGRLKFLGISGDKQNLSALVFIPERGPGLFHAGDHLAEFVLRTIEKDCLVLELEDETVMLKR